MKLSPRLLLAGLPGFLAWCFLAAALFVMGWRFRRIVPIGRRWCIRRDGTTYQVIIGTALRQQLTWMRL